MGWKPRDVYGATVPEFWACWEAWNDAQDPAEPERMTLTELDALMAEHGLT